MTQVTKAGFVALALAVVTQGAVGCARTEPAVSQAPASNQTSAAAPAAAGAIITFKTDPDPARTGDNTFEAVVMQDGKPVTDATVSAEFVTAAMPETRIKTDLASAGNGVYRGKGRVMMAGNWHVTVVAMRNGHELASKRLTVIAK